MDHAHVEDHGLIARYLPGLLAAEEEERFEEHLAGCRECQDQVALDRGLRQGLRAVAAEEAATRAAVAQLGLVAWLARRSRGVQAGLLAAALAVAAGLPTAILLNRPAPRPAVAAGATPLVVLSRFRSEPGEPAATLDLARLGELVVLAVEIDPDPGVAGYRVAVDTVDGRRLFRQDGLRPNAFDALMLTFPSSLFAPGDYRLLVEGVDAEGATAETGGYPFRVVARPGAPAGDDGTPAIRSWSTRRAAFHRFGEARAAAGGTGGDLESGRLRVERAVAGGGGLLGEHARAAHAGELGVSRGPPMDAEAEVDAPHGSRRHRGAVDPRLHFAADERRATVRQEVDVGADPLLEGRESGRRFGNAAVERGLVELDARELRQVERERVGEAQDGALANRSAT